jgi:hypothetical protein
MNKKGQIISAGNTIPTAGLPSSISSLFIVILVGVLLIFFFIAYFTISFVLPSFVWIANETITDTSLISSTIPGTEGATSFGVRAMSGINNSLAGILYITFFLFIGGFALLAYNVKSHNWLIFVWIAFMILLAGMGLIMKEAYNSLAPDNLYGSTSTLFSLNSFMINNYVWIISSVGLVLGILLFIRGMGVSDSVE